MDSVSHCCFWKWKEDPWTKKCRMTLKDEKGKDVDS